jgi:DNA polymerase III subunit delta'
MPLVPLYGHEPLRARLADVARRGTLPASLLLEGPRGVGKQRLALWLAQLLLCRSPGSEPCGECQACRYSAELTHPDLHWYFPRPRLKDADPDLDDVAEDYRDAIRERVHADGLYLPASGSEGIYVATIRAIVQQASITPALGSRKIFVIGDAERMVSQEGSDQAANAFLKLLEEPPADTFIILTSSESGALLPTIRSRVISLRVPRLSEADVAAFAADSRVAKQIGAGARSGPPAERVRTAGGAPGALLGAAALEDALSQARRLLEGAKAERTVFYATALRQGVAKARGNFSETLDALTVLLHERARDGATAGNDAVAYGAARSVEVVEEVKEMTTTNVNPQLATAYLLRRLRELLP